MKNPKHREVAIHIHEDDIRNLCVMLVNTIMTRHGHKYLHAQKLLLESLVQGTPVEAMVANEHLISCLKDTIKELEKNASSFADIENAPLSDVPKSPTDT